MNELPSWLFNMSDHESNALVALYKRASLVESLSLLCKKNEMSDLLVIWANCSQKRVIRSKQIIFSYVFSVLPCFYPFLCPRANRSVALYWRARERFALVALYKRAIMSKSLMLLFTKERLWVIRIHCSWHKRDGSNSLFCSQKTSDLLEKPTSKFSVLQDIISFLEILFSICLL